MQQKPRFNEISKCQKRKDERDLFGGTIIRMGKKLGIETETTQRIYTILNKKLMI